MLLRRTIPFALAILALACEPAVPYQPGSVPSTIDYAGFDPTGNPPLLPLPNPPNPATRGSRRWDPATYVVAVTGGPAGVQVTGSSAGLQPQATMYLLESCFPECPNGKGLTDPLNQGLFPGTRQEKAAAGAL